MAHHHTPGGIGSPERTRHRRPCRRGLHRHHDRPRHHRFPGPQRAASRSAGAAAGSRRPNPGRVSRPRTSPGPTTFRSTGCASTATRSSSTSTTTSCWSAAPGGAPRRPRRPCATPGLANVHILDGGITAWAANGFPVNRGAQRWDLERQVRLVAGSIVLTSVLASLAVPRARVAGRRRSAAGWPVAALTNTCAMGMALAEAALQPRRRLRCPAIGPNSSVRRPESERRHDRAHRWPGRVCRHCAGTRWRIDDVRCWPTWPARNPGTPSRCCWWSG